jgi:hypothetical protein
MKLIMVYIRKDSSHCLGDDSSRKSKTSAVG